MDATSATKRSMVTICSPDAARMADSRWLRRRASRLDMGDDVGSPRQICARPHPSRTALKFLVAGGMPQPRQASLPVLARWGGLATPRPSTLATTRPEDE